MNQVGHEIEIGAESLPTWRISGGLLASNRLSRPQGGCQCNRTDDLSGAYQKISAIHDGVLMRSVTNVDPVDSCEVQFNPSSLVSEPEFRNLGRVCCLMTVAPEDCRSSSPAPRTRRRGTRRWCDERIVNCAL